jgi:hypothetical protein
MTPMLSNGNMNRLLKQMSLIVSTELQQIAIDLVERYDDELNSDKPVKYIRLKEEFKYQPPMSSYIHNNNNNMNANGLSMCASNQRGGQETNKQATGNTTGNNSTASSSNNSSSNNTVNANQSNNMNNKLNGNSQQPNGQALRSKMPLLNPLNYLSSLSREVKGDYSLKSTFIGHSNKRTSLVAQSRIRRSITFEMSPCRASTNATRSSSTMAMLTAT